MHTQGQFRQAKTQPASVGSGREHSHGVVVMWSRGTSGSGVLEALKKKTYNMYYA